MEGAYEGAPAAWPAACRQLLTSSALVPPPACQLPLPAGTPQACWLIATQLLLSSTHQGLARSRNTTRRRRPHVHARIPCSAKRDAVAAATAITAAATAITAAAALLRQAAAVLPLQLQVEVERAMPVASAAVSDSSSE